MNCLQAHTNFPFTSLSSNRRSWFEAASLLARADTVVDNQGIVARKSIQGVLFLEFLQSLQLPMGTVMLGFTIQMSSKSL